MTNPPKHRVTFFALDARGSHLWDWDDSAIVERTFETEDLEEAVRVHREAYLESRSLSRASLAPAVERFDDLGAYLRALNVKSRLADEFPEDGTFISALTEDLPYWAEGGVTTPQHLADYLDGCFEREMQKECYA